MRKLWISALSLSLLGVGVSLLPTAAHAQDTTPPTIAFGAPPPGATFTRCESIPVVVTIADDASGLDRTSVVLQAGDLVIPIPEGSISLVGVVMTSIDASLLRLGPLTLNVTARDQAGNTGMASRSIEIICSFDCAAAMVVNASARGNFACAGVDRHLFALIQHARQQAGSDRERCRLALQLALACVTQRSRVPGRGAERALFKSDAASEAAARMLEEELTCLLAKC